MVLISSRRRPRGGDGRDVVAGFLRARGGVDAGPRGVGVEYGPRADEGRIAEAAGEIVNDLHRAGHGEGDLEDGNATRPDGLDGIERLRRRRGTDDGHDADLANALHD